MDLVPLGRTGLVSSVIGLGGGSSGRFGLAKGGTRADAIRLIRSALDEGITFFDGAGICGGVDELLAEGLGERRKDVILSTKVHLGPSAFPFTSFRFANELSSWAARRQGLVCSASTMRKRVEQTLRILRTDRIDVLHLHAVSRRQYGHVPANVIPELLRMKEEGKLRAIGVTEGFLRDPSHEMLRWALGDDCFDTIMVGFNIYNPGAARTVFPAARKAGVGVIGMFAMRGLLSGPGVETLTQLAKDAGVSSLSELAYRFARHQPGIDIVLTGTGDRAHLKANIAAATAPALPQGILDRLDAFSGGRCVDPEMIIADREPRQPAYRSDEEPHQAKGDR